MTPDFVRGKVVVLNDNAAWCWFQGERAIIHNGVVLVGSCASTGGKNGDSRGGDIDLTSWRLQDGEVRTFVLHQKFESDDHDVPAIYVRKDGRILAVYGKHGGSPNQFWRISTLPGDATDFEPTRTLDTGAGYTYQNVFRLSAERDRLYNFYRGRERNPHYTVSDDDGSTWRPGGRFLTWTKFAGDPKYSGFDGGRPYPRYAGNDRDSIHVLTTEDHPRAYDNSIYHGIVRGGKICRSDGSVIGELSTTGEAAVKPTDLTCVYEGNADNVAWTSDLRLDGHGHPYAAFSVQKNDSARKFDKSGGEAGQDIRYHYARFDGAQWRQYEIAHAGCRLYNGENDYSGLVALHPRDPDVLYVSTNSDPKTGEHLVSRADGKRHHEIFRGRTRDGGRTWEWTPLTADSTRDNLRPIVPPGDPKTTAVLWYRGTYRTWRDWDCEAVGMIDDPLS
jgi:hypothetical protein